MVESKHILHIENTLANEDSPDRKLLMFSCPTSDFGSFLGLKGASNSKYTSNIPQNYILNSPENHPFRMEYIQTSSKHQFEFRVLS